MTSKSKPRRILVTLGLLVAVLLACLFLYRPDRPVAMIVPGSSEGPAFVVQIIRPRVGLPLGGVLPPALFGYEADLGFDSTSSGASIGKVGLGRVELNSDIWDLDLVIDPDGRLTSQTFIEFDFVFQERRQRVRCQPSEVADGEFRTMELADGSELSGSFHIEVEHCIDVGTGKPLGWPAKPLVLHGSFDRLPLSAEPAPR